MRGASVIGCGAVLPPTVVTSADLERRLGTREGWILERSGIRQRHIGGTTSDLAAQAARMALSSAGLSEMDIDLVIVATSTADQTMPAASTAVQEALGISCGGFDVDAACAGYVYALISAYGFIALGYERILVIGADVYSRITDPLDRSTSVLFADGAAALRVVCERGCDLLVSDQRMPVMTGVELLQAVRAAGLGIPIIIISADVTAESAARAAGATRFIYKPLTIMQIRELIRTWLGPQMS